MWHASVARINANFTAVKALRQWDKATMETALKIALGLLHGVGTGEWENVEHGESALHVRRRLKATEMRLLFEINPSCPVFTHGKASTWMVGVGQ